MTRLATILALLMLSACGAAHVEAPDAPALYPGETPEIRRLIDRWADHYDLPRSLVHRVVQRESDYRPDARNGPYWGMLQILPQTARGVGFRGAPADLLRADVALKYGLRYLRGAWMVSDGDETAAMLWYARGYYFEAKRRGLLAETGLRGSLWSDYDAGRVGLPPIDGRGRLIRDGTEAAR